MKIKIGVMGSSSKSLHKKIKRLAYQIGKSVAEHNCILVNGACPGVPYEAAKGAKKRDGFVVGISPARDLNDHIQHYNFPTDKFDSLIFSGFGFKGRNVLNVSSSDGVIVVNGSVGTLNEFTIAYDEGRVIGVLTGSGGIADDIKKIIEICNKDTGATMIYDSNPYALVKKVVIAIRKRGTDFARRKE